MVLIDLRIWLVLGFVPYRIHKQHLPGGLCCLEIHALSWICTVKQRPSGRHDWMWQITLIEKLRQAVWAAVMQFKDSKLIVKSGELDGDIAAE